MCKTVFIYILKNSYLKNNFEFISISFYIKYHLFHFTFELHVTAISMSISVDYTLSKFIQFLPENNFEFISEYDRRGIC